MNQQPNPTGHIVIRTSMQRKTAYVRASKPGKLVPWMLSELDKAARAKGHDPGPPHNQAD